jgi:translation elongation factor P/translation initiation factor 5A
MRRFGAAAGVALQCCDQARSIYADRVRAGNIVRAEKKFWRVVSNTRSQKGQNAATYHLKMSEVPGDRKKEMSASQSTDFPEARYERLKLLFSGFDDDDFACFVYPQHATNAGEEINIAGAKLPEYQQKYLSTGMPVDMLHVFGDEDEQEPDIFCDIQLPTTNTYTVEKLSLKGMYKMASFVECDGSCSVSDVVQPGDKVRVVVRQDGSASFNGKL